MDDFTPSGLHESKNEWGARLVTILTPHIIEGFRSILDESTKLCQNNDEMEKYLMTFQNFISRIPKWSNEMVDTETKRIIDKSGCQYLEDLITCVHVIQLKILTSVRVGQKAKKVDMDIMGINDFIHKVYIHAARQFYKNVYLFDMNIPPLQKQKNNRELEVITQECILNTVRESIPVQTILKCYLDETTEDDIQEEIKEEDITPPEEKEEEQDGGDAEKVNEAENVTIEVEQPPTSDNTEIENSPSTLSFNDVDTAVDTNKNEYTIDAPKDLERLEEISKVRNEMRKQEEEDEDEEDKIKISTDPISLDKLDVHDIEMPSLSLDLDPLMDVEILT
jgi:hypothetical protein